jgi:hypothetical protein
MVGPYNIGHENATYIIRTCVQCRLHQDEHGHVCNALHMWKVIGYILDTGQPTCGHNKCGLPYREHRACMHTCIHAYV